MSKAYEVAIGLNYLDKRAEPGDVVDDVPEADIRSLLDLGAIVPVKNSAAKKSSKGTPRGNVRSQ